MVPQNAAPIQNTKENIEPKTKVQRAPRPRVRNGPEVSKGILRPISQPFTQSAITKIILIQKALWAMSSGFPIMSSNPVPIIAAHIDAINPCFSRRQIPFILFLKPTK